MDFYVNYLSVVFLELPCFSWKNPCNRVELELFWVGLTEDLQVHAHVALSGEVVHPGEVVDSLVGLHFVEHVDCDHSVGPVNIPCHLWISCKFPFINFFPNFFYNLISTF